MDAIALPAYLFNSGQLDGFYPIKQYTVWTDVDMNLLVFNLKTDADDSVLGFTTDWINALAKKCDRVVVITMFMGRLAVDQNVQVFSIGKEKSYSEPRRLIEFYRLLIKVLRTEKIDACFAHMIQLFAILGWPLLKIKKIPILLWYEHSHVPISLRIATALVDRIVAASPNGFRIKTHKFRSIGHGVDIQRFTPATTSSISTCQKVRLLTLGRLSPVKCLETAIEAIALLPDKLKHRIELRYIGDPIDAKGKAYASQLKETVSKLALENVVTFQPALPFFKVQAAYHSADIFINSSNTDSIDKTVLEAMSCGLAVITSNSAFVNVFEEALAKQWCIPKNRPDILARRVEQLVAMSPQERQELGSRLRERVKASHSLEALSRRLVTEVIPSIDAC
ncbi:MAG: glycosyltransferase family 4 protein [Cyanobacteria bacterium J06581_3]